MLGTLPNLSVENAIVLVRAARMYQEAIWIANSTPELSWIMLVSAIETIANQWQNRIFHHLVEKLRMWRPELENILRHYGGDNADELVQKVAKEIAPYIGATGTFRDFIIEVFTFSSRSATTCICTTFLGNASPKEVFE